MMISQLNPPIPVITPKGKAIAHALIDYGMEQDLQWVCFQDSTGECWTWRNPQVRAQVNITHGRDYISPFYHPSEVAFKKDEDDEDDEEDEDEEEEMNWQAAYYEMDEERTKKVRELNECRSEKNKYKDSRNELILLLVNLYNDDQIHPNHRGIVHELLMKTEELKDGFDGRIVSKSQIN